MIRDLKNEQVTIGEDKWSFLEREIVKKPRDIGYIKEHCIPLGTKNAIHSESYKYKRLLQSAIPIITEEILRKGLNPTNFSISSCYWQDYGVPDEPRYAEPIVDYFKHAVSFLYNHLSGLSKQNLEFIIIKDGDNYEREFNQKGFIVHSRYEVHGIKATNTSNPSLNFELPIGLYYHVGGAARMLFNEETKEMDRVYYVFSANGSALNSIFSELIHVTTMKRSIKYSQEVGYDIALQADEALVEAISYLLALDIVNELNIPVGIKHIQETQKELNSPRYNYVHPATKWMQKYGMQEGFDFYMESPKKFMDEITKHSP